MESRFLSDLVVKSLDDATWELTGALIYQSELLNQTIAVPAGFVTDLASVPRVPIIYEIWGDRAHHESVPHDWIYQTHVFPKELADKCFLEMMTVRLKPWYIKMPMYWGVVIGGPSAYESGPKRFKILNS